jgi:hypothetical protein
VYNYVKFQQIFVPVITITGTLLNKIVGVEEMILELTTEEEFKHFKSIRDCCVWQVKNTHFGSQFIHSPANHHIYLFLV